ncbi:hypothetical protein [Streptomyces odontomachi]|uniref:hypothetical protein n=1 Tax=Streptomyces odontomachi TaxID=2944940 RepID=UPI00210D0873|nr:hypothetical protein [Streptomyces sp. ODS25]
MNKRTLALAGATVLCAGGIAFAATASASTHGASPVASSQGSSDSGKGSKGEKGPDLSDLPKVLHSEQVMQDPKTGKITTKDEQTGKVTSASGSSVTVKSADGTTWVWKLTKDTSITTEKSAKAKASDVKTGDSVLIAGDRAGDTRTARTLSDPATSITKGVGEKLRKRFGSDLDKKDLDDLRNKFRKEFGGLPKLKDRPGMSGMFGGGTSSSDGSAGSGATDTAAGV